MKTLKIFSLVVVTVLILIPLNVSAHCDSYDGPLIKDALNAIETENVFPVLKWIEPDYETEITDLFKKTVSLKQGDPVIYGIVEKHFLETLVRLHRQGEGASFTGLKPAGSASKIVVMADDAIVTKSAKDLTLKLSAHLTAVINEKYNEVMEKNAVKNNSTAAGREYVRSYVEYTHFLEAVHSTITDNAGHAGHSGPVE